MTELNAGTVAAFVLASAAGAIVGTIAVRWLERWANGAITTITPGP